MTAEPAQYSVLIVDDDDDILDLLSYNFERSGFSVFLASDGQEALREALEHRPDLIILDVMMPVMDGIETCRHIRRNSLLRNTPIIMLTARTEDVDQVEGLEIGADVYLGKPISVPVVLSQARALLRSTRRSEAPPDVLNVHDLEINRDRYLVVKPGPDGQPIELRLPRKEFELLYFIASHPGRVFTRQDLLDHVWGSDVYVVDRTVDVHVRKIREKLGSEYIETVKGVGYKFVD
ncbi:MAG: response regulator transcription factor [Bacteroidota bacterium]